MARGRGAALLMHRRKSRAELVNSLDVSRPASEHSTIKITPRCIFILSLFFFFTVRVPRSFFFATERTTAIRDRGTVQRNEGRVDGS